MIGIHIELTSGMRVGSLTLVKEWDMEFPNGSVRKVWRCVCDCGVELDRQASTLRAAKLRARRSGCKNCVRKRVITPWSPR